MVRRLTCALLAIMTCTNAQASTSEKYPVSILASEMGFEEFGDILFRYVEFDFFSEYPCLRFESLTHHSKLIDRIEACTFRMGGKTVDVRRKDLVDAIFKHYNKAKENEFHFTAKLDFTRPGQVVPLEYYQCKVTVSPKGKLSGPICEKLDERAYDEMDKQDEKSEQKNKAPE